MNRLERDNAPNRIWQVCPFTGLPVEITEVRVGGSLGVSIQYRCLTRIDACRPGVCPLFPDEGESVPKTGPYELPYRNDRGICDVLLSGLGGDGANTAAKMLLEVAINQMGLDGGLDAKYGSEKTGTPTDVSIRLTDVDSPIRTSGPTQTPHILVVFHTEWVRPLRLSEGLRENATVIVNTAADFDEIRDLLELHSGTLYLLNATAIAQTTRSRLNMPLLAALCRVLGIPDAALEESILRKWPRQADRNLAAFRAARAGARLRHFDPDGRYPSRPRQTVHPAFGYETMASGGSIRAVDALSVPEKSSRRSISPPPNFTREACIDCVLCLTVCPDPGALVWSEGRMTGIDPAYCKACMRCVAVCPQTKKGRALTAP